MAAPVRITLFPKCNSIAFYPAVPSGLNVLGQASYKQTTQDWQVCLPYTQKALFGDTITIQVHTQIGTAIPLLGPQLFICDNNQNVIAGINLNTTPYFKGLQPVAGNYYNDPFGGASYPLFTSTWSFNFGNFPGQISDGGIFYLRLDNQMTGQDTISCFSEPILVSNTHPDTKLFEFYFNTNNAYKNVINSGWFNDYPANTQPYSLVFTIRAEAYINLFTPKAINIGYMQQNYQQLQIKTQMVRTFTLKLGEISIGIPYYLLEMLTECMLADMVFIDGYSYILFNPSSNSSLADIWKIKDSDVAPLITANCPVMERFPQQSALVSPSLTIPSRIFDDVFSPEFD